MEASPFAKLSQELRDIIFEYALIDDEPISLHLSGHSTPSFPNALLQTCRAMRDQAHVFYAGNTFLIVETWEDEDDEVSITAEAFFTALCPGHRAQVRQLTVDFGLLGMTRFTSDSAIEWYCESYRKIQELQQ
ncbi:hypothetical protein LTR95_015362, partial [Oleoguttula sp. CCFEE 5521]